MTFAPHPSTDTRRRRRPLAAVLAAAVFFLVLAACGGGGGGGGGAPANQAPTASLSVAPTTGNAPLTVALNASASSDADGSIATYAWTFGDGATDAGATVSHTYTAGGTFTAAVTVTDDDGATDSASRTITVTNIVSGTVSTAATMVFDSDVNDPGAPYTQNDTVASAQEITSPATVGGYLNIVGSGNAGRSRDIGDASDFFKGSLADGQTITLQFPDVSASDLDLYLYDSAGGFLASSVGAETTKTLTANAGEPFYYIEVRITSDASNYTLFVGQSVSSVDKGALYLNHDFVPGEVVVRFRDDAIGTAAVPNMNARAESVGLQPFSGGPGRAMRMGFRDSYEKQEAFEQLDIAAPVQASVFAATGLSDDDVREKMDTLSVVMALRQRSDVLTADPNYILRPALTTPNDPSWASQWHYPLINLDDAWDTTTGDDSVIVAAVDTGVLLTHPDLSGRLVSGYDFVSSTYRSRDNDGIDADPTDPGSDPDPGDSTFHGTHVAGTIAAATHNGTGGAGVTWSGKVMPVRVLGRGGGTSYDVLQGIRYAAGLSNDSGTVPAQAADIINLSLGGSSYSSSEQALYTQVRNAGIIVVAAAGNSGSSTKSYPAAYHDVVSVSAVDRTEALAYYSNYGSTIDVAAPGGETNVSSANGIYSTVGDDSSGSVVMTYAFYQGTSMATPHVAGVAALMKSVHSAMTPDEFDGLLQRGVITEDLGLAGRDNSFGYGLIDAQKAVAEAAALAGGGALPATLVVDPNTLSFGSALTALTLDAFRSGSGALTINTVTDDAAWLTVTATSVDANGLGTYTAQVDRTTLSVGTHTGTITFDSDVNDIEIPVTVQVSSGLIGSNEGYHYVILLDPDTLDPKYQAAGATVGGDLDYTLTGVQPGSYRLFSGTDADNNGTIGDAGESIGAYTSLESPVTVPVSTNRSGLDFDAEFNLVNQPSSAGAGTATPSAVKRLKTLKSVN